MYLALLVLAIIFFVAAITVKHIECVATLMVVVPILAILPVVSYYNHAENIGTLRAQDKVVQVYSDRVVELTSALNTVLPAGNRDSNVLLNADSPIKGLVEATTTAVSEKATAAVKKAQAEVSIAQRKAGPFWFIVSMCGEK